MHGRNAVTIPRDIGSIARRATLLSIVWVILGRTGPIDLVVGIIIATGVATLSIALTTSAHRPVSYIGIVRFALRFISRSLSAGADVALRVLGRRVRVNPGIRSVNCAIPPGMMRQLFSSLSSLQPGILPLGGDECHIRLHCLDINGPVETDIAADADAFMAIYRTHAQ